MSFLSVSLSLMLLDIPAILLSVLLVLSEHTIHIGFIVFFFIMVVVL
jgi:hypothetical protein